MKKEMQDKDLLFTDSKYGLLNDETQKLKYDLDISREHVSQLRKKIFHLMSLLLQNSDLLEKLERKDSRDKSLTLGLWVRVQEVIREIEPEFMKKLKRQAFALTEKEKQICCLVKLNVPISRIGILLKVDKESISRYKSKIVKDRFGRNDGIFLDHLLQIL